jgi:protein O-mannosyl-transferase
MPGSPAPVDPAREDPGHPPVGLAARLRRAGLPGLLVVILLYLLAYARTAHFAFVWDDPGNFAQSPLMHGPLAGVIRKGEHARADPAIERLPKDLVPRHESYRPLTVASHWLDVRFFDRRPGPMHLHSILLGLLSIVFVHLLAGKLGIGLWLPGLWALHPLHVEVFAYLSARSDLLAALGSLAALLLGIRASDAPSRRARWLWAIGASVCHGLSLLAKEGNLGLPFAFLALAVGRGRTRASLGCFFALLLASAAYFPLRSFLMQAESLPAVQTQPILRSLVDAPGVALAYAASFVSPFSLSPDRQLWPPFVSLGWAVLGLLVTVGALGWRRIPAAVRPQVRLAAWTALALVPLLLPAALGVRSIGALSDRYACFALFFLGLLTVALARVADHYLLAVPRLLRNGLALVWAGIVLATTWLQIGAWRNEESLARHAAVMEPDNSAALYRLATVATMRGQFPTALPLLERAVALDPGNQRALNNLAVTYLHLGRLADAKAILRQQAPVARSTDKRFWYNVAAVQFTDGKRDKACSALSQALAIDPGYAPALALRERACSSPTPIPGPSAAPPASPDARPRP